MTRYTDTDNRALLIHIELARKLISQAQWDLHRTLSAGEQRDLLADNLTWCLDYISRVVSAINWQIEQ